MLPNFIHIGAAKSASTWLWTVYNEHPEVYVHSEVDNINFFVGDYHRGLDWYADRYYGGWNGEKAAGDMSNSYMMFMPAMERIARDLPGIKLTMSLRNPIERAFIHWAHMSVTKNWLPEQRMSLEMMQDVHMWQLFFMWAGPGFYGTYLKNVYRLFPRENVLVMFYDDLVSRPKWFAESFFAFLGVDTGFRPSVLNTIVGFPHGVPAADHPTDVKTDIFEKGMPPETRAYLQDVFREDIAQLEELTSRDLSGWA